VATIEQGLVPAAARAVPRRLWMHGPVADIVLGWSWLPIALAVRQLESHPDVMHWVIAVVFMVSFAHQPLTLGLVYGDPAQRQAHRRLYTWAPFVAVALIAIGLNVSLTTVALMAGLWNAEHTLMQRYGVIRIYGRKAGDDHARLEKPMLIVWLVTAIAFLGAYIDLDRFVVKMGMGGTNRRSVTVLAHLHAPSVVLFWVGAIASVVLAARWFAAERRLGAASSRPKWWYVAGTLGLVAMVMIDPVAGIAGYVAMHAIEYLAIVHHSLRTRTDDSPVAVATRTPGRRAVIYVAYVAAIAGVVWFCWNFFDGRLYAYTILFFGALHILYDGFVWKLRRPAVAASLGIESVS
jgi:uncharacterized membrane protein YidH (DUF202 family)